MDADRRRRRQVDEHLFGYDGDMSAGLTNGEVIQVVNRYIGVSGGYLGDFSYRTHAEFLSGFRPNPVSVHHRVIR
jgi:hypothetical protein